MPENNFEYDVTIVGGGPAGSTLAWVLRDSGLRVAILDKQVFPRDKVCAGWVTPEVMETLQLDQNDYRQHGILQPVYGFRVSQLGQREVETHQSADPVSYSIRRCEFDNYLLRRSQAELLLGQPFRSMQVLDGGWRINDKFNTRLVVGAGGHFCPVARQLGAKLGSAETIISAQEIEFEMTDKQLAECSVNAEVPELFFCEDLKGYGWVVRKQNYLNIGLGRDDNRKLKEHLARFREFLISRHKIPADTPKKFHGHAYLLYTNARRPLIADNALLIGDAAGLAYPQSGEGIRPGIESAVLAADVIRQAKGDYSKANLQSYESRLTQRLGPRRQKGFKTVLPEWLKRFLAGRLLSTRWFVQRFVMNRWFLHRQQAALKTE